MSDNDQDKSDGESDSIQKQRPPLENNQNVIETEAQPYNASREPILESAPSPTNLTSSLTPNGQASTPAFAAGLDGAKNFENKAEGRNPIMKNALFEDTRHKELSRVKANLSLDTNGAREEPDAGAKDSTSIAFGPSATVKTAESAISPHRSQRSRNRGFSSRRSLFARNVHKHSESSGSALELQPTGSPSMRPNPLQEASTRQSSVKSEAPITVTPLTQDTENTVLPPPSVKGGPGSSTLTHYASWIRNRTARAGPLGRLQKVYYQMWKTIARITEVPPSKNGRYVELDAYRREDLIDERTGRAYIGNTIRSSRYTLWNFLPRQLFAQFSKLANFYFLCVSILQMIPGLSTTGTYTTIVPLLFFVTISMAKEGYDDLRRYRLDRAENMKTASILHTDRSMTVDSGEMSDSSSITSNSKSWTAKKWKEIRVGDIVRLTRNEPAPADLVILQAKEVNGIAYVETMALDGETNLKSKQALLPLRRACKTAHGIAHCSAQFLVEDPNLDLYKFEGKVTLAEGTLPLTNNEIIYRGSIIRNTPETIGVVIYTGEECKIRMNATKNPRTKAPALQHMVNKIVIIMVIFVLLLAIFNTAAYEIWSETTEEKSWYIVNAKVAFFPILTSFIILFNTMIPLSLYVSLEIVKLFQMLFMNDIDMYDEDSNTPMEARTSTINEELGQVSYIFSDKTGTLTNNSMRFRKLSIAGTAWLHDPDVQAEAMEETARRTSLRHRGSKGKKPISRKPSVSPSTQTPRYSGVSSPVGLRSSISAAECSNPVGLRRRSSARPNTSQPILRTAELLQYIQRKPHTIFAQRVRMLFISLALCHTCIPEKTENGDIDFQAASPDEQALVRAAQELGYIVVDRQTASITIKSFPFGPSGESHFETHQILDVIEFSSSRKRMSIIVRMPDHRICVFCKGADSTIVKLLRLSSLASEKAGQVERRVSRRRSLEAREAMRRDSKQQDRKNSRSSLSIHRHSLGGITRPSLAAKRLQPIRDKLHDWLDDRETEVGLTVSDDESIYYSPRPSAHHNIRQNPARLDGRSPTRSDDRDELVEEALVADDAKVFERCFQHVNDFASEGLRTLLYGYRYLEKDEYATWKKVYLEASTSLINRQELIESAGSMVEKDLELAGATAIEDKLQYGVPEAIDKLRRANIKLWMLTGDKRETAINIGHSCRLIKDYSSIIVLDYAMGDVQQSIAAATVEISSGDVAHSVVVIDGQTLAVIEAEEISRKLFIDLAISADTVICCRASPSQKAYLVRVIRKKVKNAITLAIGDGANDIAMIQEAHVGIGITGKEGLQAARTADYSIAQFRFLLKLLLVHGRWNYIRTCKYTLSTFWKELLFYLTQALYQRYAGYTGTSLYESWSLSMFNTLFTSLPVIFMGIFEKDLAASTLLAVPELYTVGQRNGGFNLVIYAFWVFMASSEAMIIFFIMLGLYGQALFTMDNGLYAMGALTFTACVVLIATKIQFLEVHNKSITCVIAMVLSIGGWFLWNIILSAVYSNNVIYDVKEGFLQRFGRNALWWLTLILIVSSCWAFEIGVKSFRVAWEPSDTDIFQELEKDKEIRMRFEEAAAGAGTGIVDPGCSGREAAATRPRTIEEETKREAEVQELLDRPRVMDGIKSGPHVRQRQRSASRDKGHRNGKVVDVLHQAGDDDDDDDNNGKGKGKGKSGVLQTSHQGANVHKFLKRGFGAVRRSLDLGNSS